jgi:hypothetical protein
MNVNLICSQDKIFRQIYSNERIPLKNISFCITCEHCYTIETVPLIHIPEELGNSSVLIL